MGGDIVSMPFDMAGNAAIVAVPLSIVSLDTKGLRLGIIKLELIG